ncbi:unnamed protein product, partial [Ixodes pacificus]
TIRTVKRFLTLWNYEGSTCPRSGEALNLSAAARSRYEMFKKHTKDELRHRWDLMLEGKESSLQIARWDVQMDICAPQIIVPESFSEGSSTVVLIDLGHVQFSNSAMLHKTPPDKMEDISDDEGELFSRSSCLGSMCLGYIHSYNINRVQTSVCSKYWSS